MKSMVVINHVIMVDFMVYVIMVDFMVDMVDVMVDIFSYSEFGRGHSLLVRNISWISRDVRTTPG